MQTLIGESKTKAAVVDAAVAVNPFDEFKGQREIDDRKVALRRLGGRDQEFLALDEAVARLTEEGKSPALV